MEQKPEETTEQKTKYIFSEEELENIAALGEVLQGIRTRLISEGFSIDELREKLYGQSNEKC